jgi:hypothetical protein
MKLRRIRAYDRPQRFRDRFPVVDQQPVHPTDPKEERSRADIDAHPEGPVEQLERTRRYVRLANRQARSRVALGSEDVFDTSTRREDLA